MDHNPRRDNPKKRCKCRQLQAMSKPKRNSKKKKNQKKNCPSQLGPMDESDSREIDPEETEPMIYDGELCFSASLPSTGPQLCDPNKVVIRPGIRVSSRKNPSPAVNFLSRPGKTPHGARKKCTTQTRPVAPDRFTRIGYAQPNPVCR